MNSLSIRLNGPRAVNKSFTINWHTAGTSDSYHTELCNALLNNREGVVAKAAVTISLPLHMLAEFALGQIVAGDIAGQM